MTFRTPLLLLFLVVVVLLALAYVIAQFRRRRYIVIFPNVDAIAQAAPRNALWRRHATAAVFLGMLVALVVAFARPGHTARVARRDAALMVALDVSRSMEADDVAPTRLAAAKRQASSFIESLPPKISVGVVVFSQVASVPVQPTTSRSEALQAIERAQPGNGTAIGEAILQGLVALREHRVKTQTGSSASDAPIPDSQIVLLSDGETTAGRSSAEASDAAHQAKVKVSTIAFGTRGGSVVTGGEKFDVPVLRRELREVADATGGKFFTATSSDELGNIYQNVEGRVAYHREWVDASAWLVFGVLLVGLAVLGATFAWSGRVP